MDVEQHIEIQLIHVEQRCEQERGTNFLLYFTVSHFIKGISSKISVAQSCPSTRRSSACMVECQYEQAFPTLAMGGGNVFSDFCDVDRIRAGFPLGRVLHYY